jgi:hypothetical protein
VAEGWVVAHLCHVGKTSVHEGDNTVIADSYLGHDEVKETSLLIGPAVLASTTFDGGPGGSFGRHLGVMRRDVEEESPGWQE